MFSRWNARRSTVLEVALIAVACLLLFFFRLGGFGLLGADEPRYAQVAREMHDRNDWVTPVLYGQPWLEKPIAYYWGAIAAFKIFGVSDWAARLPSATLATLMTGFIYVFLRRFRPGMRVDGPLMVASAALIFGFAHGASTDMVLAAPFAIAMLAWFGWRESESRSWLLVSYVALAVATLAKGPVAPGLAFLILAVFCAVTRDWRSLGRTFWVPGILAFLAVALPWYVLVQVRTPEFFRAFFLEHNLARFGTNMFRHKQPFWYYVPVVLLATAPWTVLFVAAVVEGLRGWWKSRKSNVLAMDPFAAFLLVWFLVPVAFFSISQSKLPGYILPAVPPCLLLAAHYLQRRTEEDRPIPFWMAGLHAALLGVLAAAVVFSPALVLKVAATRQAIVIAAVAGTLTLLAVGRLLLSRGWRAMRAATLVPLVLMVSFVLRVVSSSVDLADSARPVARLLTAVGVSPETQVATFKVRRDVAFGMGFYRNQTAMAYEGLEISPGRRVTPPGMPPGEHVVIAREGSLPELRELLPGRDLVLLGYFRPQRLEIYSVTAAR
ncbi:MAG TPA: glycosyltransferase family 39 protein [Clostridia bacterium]|nr:glycosyltransferase family 39 protein [Clostridia bacterium]